MTEIARRAREFEGAWVYLELIARASGIADQLDARVVEAYWVGNALLEDIDSGWFLAQLRRRFRGQSGGQWAGAIPTLEARLFPQHAFHVFAIYPWVGLLRRDNDVPRSILDQCRIRTGVVVSVDGPRAKVEVSPLSWDGRRLGIGSVETLDVRWSEGGRSMLDGVRMGDRVSVHWDWVCDILTAEQAGAIEDYERRQLEVTNRILKAGLALRYRPAMTVPVTSPRVTTVPSGPGAVPRSVTVSPSCRKPRVDPSARVTGCSPFQVISRRLPNVSGVAPLTVPDAEQVTGPEAGAVDRQVRQHLRGRPVHRAVLGGGRPRCR